MEKKTQTSVKQNLPFFVINKSGNSNGHSYYCEMCVHPNTRRVCLLLTPTKVRFQHVL